MSNHNNEQRDDDRILREWCVTLVNAFELHGLQVDITSVLSLAGSAAHSVLRPAAPLTTFVAGYAAGLATGSGSAHQDAAIDSALKTAFRLCSEATPASESST